MNKETKLISVVDFCRYYNVEVGFVNSLKEYELIEVTTIENREFIYPNQLHHLEKVVRLHYDLDINIEGIDVIMQLLERMEQMKEEMRALKNKLRF